MFITPSTFKTRSDFFMNIEMQKVHNNHQVQGQIWGKRLQLFSEQLTF
jgi:hypothetical protein